MAEKQMTSLEDKLKKLEELTVSLESGKLSIDEAISVYSQGMQLAVECKGALDNLTQKIELAKKNAQQALSSQNSNSFNAKEIESSAFDKDPGLPF